MTGMLVLVLVLVFKNKRTCEGLKQISTYCLCPRPCTFSNCPCLRIRNIVRTKTAVWGSM